MQKNLFLLLKKHKNTKSAQPNLQPTFPPTHPTPFRLTQCHCRVMIHPTLSATPNFHTHTDTHTYTHTHTHKHTHTHMATWGWALVSEVLAFHQHNLSCALLFWVRFPNFENYFQTGLPTKMRANFSTNFQTGPLFSSALWSPILSAFGQADRSAIRPLNMGN